MTVASGTGRGGDVSRAGPQRLARTCRTALPSLSFVVHSFNRCRNVEALARGLARLPSEEIIVCDDGSIDGSREAWTRNLSGPDGWIVLSNDLHEIRILDRAIAMSKGDVVCLVQDDDRIPPGEAWLEPCLAAFRRHPELAVVGGFMGFNGFDTDPSKVERIWEEGPFRFVEHVNIGPFFVRRSAYRALGGWDFSFAAAGEPGICFDNELCLRCWMNGMAVGYLFVPFKGPARTYSRNGGTDLFMPSMRRANQLRNEALLFAKYNAHADRIAERVRRANATLGEGNHLRLAP